MCPTPEPVLFLPHCVPSRIFTQAGGRTRPTKPVRTPRRSVCSMLFRFGVILTPDSSDVAVFVLGSRPEMGHWDPNGAVQLKASHRLPSPREPSLWVGDVELEEPFKDTLWFKFVKRVGGTYVWEGNSPHVSRTARRTPPCLFMLCAASSPPHDGAKVTPVI